LTHRLNDTKRDSENRLEAKRLLSQIGRHSLRVDRSEVCMVRYDDIVEVVSSTSLELRRFVVTTSPEFLETWKCQLRSVKSQEKRPKVVERSGEFVQSRKCDCGSSTKCW